MAKKFVKFLFRARALFFMLLMLMLAMPAQFASASTTIVVTPASPDWAFLNDNGTTGDWSTGFQSGPATAPLGVGSISINLNSATAGIVFGSQKYVGTRLADIQALRYSTYTNLSPAAMTFQINYDPDVTTVEATTWYGRLIYEPYRNGTVINGTWQTWDMLNGGAGKWWASPNASSPVDNVCSQASPCTLTALLTAFPNVGIRNDAQSFIQFKAGSNWNNFSGNVDNLTVQIAGNTDIYDFEPLSTVYVDDSWTAVTPGTDPDGAGPATNYDIDSFDTIQEGIDAVGVGGTVQVMAGTYVEDPFIDKAINLLGPNQGIDPNTGTRAPEAILHPAVSNPDPNICEVVAYLSASNITMDGFTIDGDNPALTSGIMINGADVDACELIAGYDGMGNIKVENNILKNSTYSGVDFYNYYDPAATSGNYIRYNLIEAIGETTYNWGMGVLIYNNFYADITNNVFTGVRTGIQTGNFFSANPGATGSISNNQIGTWRLGIFHNLAYGSASPLTISNNILTAENYPGATKWNGMLLSSVQGTVSVTISGNSIIVPGTVSYSAPGYTAGYNVWSMTSVTPVTISGGTVNGGNYGVWVNNYAGYSSDASSTAIKIDGVAISNASLAGIYVQDDPLNSNGATVNATITNSPITSSAVGILIEGSDAAATGSCNQISGNTAGLTNTTATLLGFENNWWGAVSGPSGSGSGSGDTVSTNVDFTPWSTDTTCTSFAPPFTTLTAITADTPDPSAIGQTVSVSATVTGLPAGAPTPTGTVTISGGMTDCVINLVAGAGACDITFNTSGPKTITATYNPDTSNFAISSDTENHNVNSATATATSTETATSTGTSTVTPTAADTATVTATVTPTVTLLAPTDTATTTPTATLLVSTNTATSTSTATALAATDTATSTPTPTLLAATATATPTVTRTATSSPVSVTINQAATQLDPTTVSPIHFTAVFSEGVSGFTGTDISFYGTTLSGTLSATVTQITPTTYDVAVKGMIPKGTVFVRIPAGAATSISRPGVTNQLSTSTDNEVTFDYILAEFTSTAAKDGWLLESTETSSVGGSLNSTSTTLTVGDDGIDRQYRSLLDFTTNTLPDNAVLYSVNLRIVEYSVTGINPFTTHGFLRSEIKSGFFGVNGLLATPDFEFSPDAAACNFETVPEILESIGAAYRCVVSPTAFPYINRTGSTQLRLRFTADDNDDMSADLFNFYSGDFASPSQGPRLFIKYYIPPAP